MQNLYYNPKKLKKIRNKRTQKGRKIWGGVLVALGIMSLSTGITNMDTGNLVASLFFLVPGILFLLSTRKTVRRWDNYEAIIDNQGNTPISLIAEKTGLSERQVYVDLQEMIHSDFFIGPNYNIEAYIDAERNMLVMSSGGKPLKPLPDIEEKPAQAAANAGYDAEEEEEDMVEENLSDLDRIRQVIPLTKDEETRSYLYGLEGSLRRIDERVQDNPELKEKTSIKRLYKYYLPQIMELIRKYQAPDTPADLKDEIRDALRTSAHAMSNIEADFLERDQMDAEVDIEVLKKMFAQDGLLHQQMK